MPYKLKRACNKVGCPELTHDRYCDKHRKEYKRSLNVGRKTGSAAGYNARWRKARKYYLSQHPLCVHCKQIGRTTAANVVDHIIDHKGDMAIFWDVTNWQSLCTFHHNSKTAKTVFGKKKQQDAKPL